MKRTKAGILLVAGLVGLQVAFNLPVLFAGGSDGEFWQRPILGFLPASIAYYFVWLALTVPFGWWLLHVTWRDAR